MGGEKRLGMVVPYLVYVIYVELCRVIGLLRFRRPRDGGRALLSES
jgi:hypothetical protein